MAKVEGGQITAGEFRARYIAQMQAYRQSVRRPDNEQLLRQLGVDQQILQQLVDEAGRARRSRATASGQRREVRAAHPHDSRVPGERRGSSASSATSSCSQRNNPPLYVAEFEDSLRRSADGRQAARRA